MSKNVKVGEFVRSLISQFDVIQGGTYRVCDVDDSGVYVIDGVVQRFYLTHDEYERGTEVVNSVVPEQFIVTYNPPVFNSQEEAEEYIRKEYAHGTDVTVGKLIRNVTVKRTVVVTLEDSQ